jgi:FlaA1/EpsC-like NDP-sugar epimerase
VCTSLNINIEASSQASHFLYNEMRSLRIPVPRLIPFNSQRKASVLSTLHCSNRALTTTATDSPKSPEPVSRGLLAGKKVLITGASRGIGAAIAERFAREGARCIIVGRDEEKLKDVRDRLRVPPEGEHSVQVGDVGSLEFWEGIKRKEVSVAF